MEIILNKIIEELCKFEGYDLSANWPLHFRLQSLFSTRPATKGGNFNLINSSMVYNYSLKIHHSGCYNEK